MIDIEVARTDEASRIPVVVAPGHADNAITISLGYGQAGVGEDGPGRVGEGTGVDVYPLRRDRLDVLARRRESDA